jgi:hypothetical protein
MFNKNSASKKTISRHSVSPDNSFRTNKSNRFSSVAADIKMGLGEMFKKKASMKSKGHMSSRDIKENSQEFSKKMKGILD